MEIKVDVANERENKAEWRIGRVKKNNILKERSTKCGCYTIKLEDRLETLIEKYEKL